MATAELLEPKAKRTWEGKPNKYHMLQLMMALVAGLSTLAPGMSMGFSAVALPELRPRTIKPSGVISLYAVADNSSVHANASELMLKSEAKEIIGNLTLTDEESAWFMSITMATTPLGCFISGYLNDLIGRKGALVSIAFPGIVGWLLLATVPTVVPQGDLAYVSTAIFAQMILGRALNGIAIGMSSSPASVLVTETTSPRFRGAVLCMNSLFISCGILLVYLLGDHASGWRMIAASGAIITGLVAFLSTILPESPVWLRSKGLYGDADWVCYRLGLKTRGAAAAEGKVDWTSDGQQESMNNAGVVGTIRLLLEPATLRPLLLLIGLFILQQASGIYVVTFNAVEIAAACGIKGAILNSRMTAVLIGMCNLVGLSLVCIFIDRLGRRPAAIFSATVMSLTMAVLGIYVQSVSPAPPPGKHHPFLTQLSNSSQSSFDNLTSPGDYGTAFNGTALPEDLAAASDSPWHSWIPLAALLTWAFSSALGIIPLPWALCPELLPARTRSVGFGILAALAYTFGFIALRVFSAVVLPLGLPGCMFIMSGAAAGLALYVAALLPETKGMAIDGLEERGGKWREVRACVNSVTISTDDRTREDEEREVLVYG